MLNSLQAGDAAFAVTHDDEWCSLEVRPSSSSSYSHYLQMERLEDICDCNAVLQCVKDDVNFNVSSNGNLT